MPSSHGAEVICIHIGQAGVQLGSACWELLAAEHGISKDGSCISEMEDTSFSTFFQETPGGQFVPRCILVDLEPSVIDEIRVGSFGRLFHPELYLEGMEDSGSNYARARYTRGQHIINLLIEQVRYLTETCSGLQGFLIFSSYGGGTGSGISSLLLDRLEHEYSRVPRAHIGFYPGHKLSSVIVEPYNSVLFNMDLIHYADFSILLENNALYRICSNNLKLHTPHYHHVNRIAAQVVSHLTTSLRYPGILDNSLNELRTNLIPYPNLKFPVVSCAPIMSADRRDHSSLSADELIRSTLYQETCMVDNNLLSGMFMTCSMIFRGGFSPSEINKTIDSMKRITNWVNWCPTGFKYGISPQHPVFTHESCMASNNRSVFMMANSTVIADSFDRLHHKFCNMYTKRAFVHWYVGEGMEEEEFIGAHQELKDLEAMYQEVQRASSDEHLEEKQPAAPEQLTTEEHEEAEKAEQEEETPNQEEDQEKAEETLSESVADSEQQNDPAPVRNFMTSEPENENMSNLKRVKIMEFLNNTEQLINGSEGDSVMSNHTDIRYFTNNSKSCDTFTQTTMNMPADHMRRYKKKQRRCHGFWNNLRRMLTNTT